jgi:hypothetical protein
MSTGLNGYTRGRLDRMVRAGLVLEWSEHIDDEEMPGGVHWLVTFNRLVHGQPDQWKMTRNMVTAFDKALRITGFYERAAVHS